MAEKKWNDEALKKAVAAAKSVYGVFRELKLKIGGGQHFLIKKRIKELGLDVTHFTGRAWNKGIKTNSSTKKPLKEILTTNSTYLNTNSLKKRLINEQLLKNECAICNLKPIWNNKPLILRIDHINGLRHDNRIENLRLLCPNCDSQTITFSGRNHGNYDNQI